MSHRRPNTHDLTPDELDAAIRGIIRQLQDATIAREGEASLTTADIDDPNSFERGLMGRLAQLRLIRKQRQGSS